MDLHSRKFAYASMGMLVVIWGFEYVAAKAALEAVSTFPLVCLKYMLGLVTLCVVKLVQDRRFFAFRRQDLLVLIVCSVTGQLLYFACEYGAMSYLPVSTISIVLAFMPAVSVVLEFFLYRKSPNRFMVAGIAAGIVGVVLVIGGGARDFFTGAGIGYLLIFGAVFCWNAYNFLTKKLAGHYTPLNLSYYQALCTALISLPFLLGDLPPASAFAPGPVLGGLLFIGFLCEGVGFLIYVNAVHKIGPTPCALFSSMLPVSTTFFGWLCLAEHILPLQAAGGVIVIVSGVYVIREKGRLDSELRIENGELRIEN
ncbi:MAG: DMT family transporter [Clostridiales Family XIII bacterium]|jgi:drug/metabolite transporter (DMT)-like permease|nr:DMT family transporter [Clostridiales Family XIII bacterium]